jgi:hypothetical protein
MGYNLVDDCDHGTREVWELIVETLIHVPWRRRRNKRREPWTFSTLAVRGLTFIRIRSSRVASDGAAKSEVRSFDTTTVGLLALSAWLTESGWPCRDGGNRRLLEAGLAHPIRWRDHSSLTLANTVHVKNMPGHKTDVARCSLACPICWPTPS